MLSDREWTVLTALWDSGGAALGIMTYVFRVFSPYECAACCALLIVSSIPEWLDLISHRTVYSEHTTLPLSAFLASFHFSSSAFVRNAVCPFRFFRRKFLISLPSLPPNPIDTSHALM